jgi:short-subunit dehydrogenase
VSDIGFGTTRPTAVVTGASSGIGEAFAHRLGGEGHDLLLVARRVSLLDQLGANLRQQHGIQCEILPVDLTDADQLDELVRRIGLLPSLAMLVHAAGFGYMGDFVDLPLEKHLRMLDLHITATMRLAYGTLPRMIASKSGALINVASLAAWTVGPGQAMYNSSKAFIKTFTESLHAELEGTGVRVQALCPGVTHTGFHSTEEFAEFDSADMPGSWMTPEDVVDESMAALQKNRPVCVPGFNNRVLTYLFSSDRIRRLAGEKVRKRPAK